MLSYGRFMYAYHHLLYIYVVRLGSRTWIHCLDWRQAIERIRTLKRILFPPGITVSAVKRLGTRPLSTPAHIWMHHVSTRHHERTLSSFCEFVLRCKDVRQNGSFCYGF